MVLHLPHERVQERKKVEEVGEEEEIRRMEEERKKGRIRARTRQGNSGSSSYK